VALLADHYDEDWEALWWARADGTARVVEPGAEPELRTAAVRALAARYPPYRARPPAGALVVIAVERWSGWSAI
jgi:PPOX class probable F420-dependent enzyme